MHKGWQTANFPSTQKFANCETLLPKQFAMVTAMTKTAATSKRWFIREWRKFRGMTQQKLAEECGTDKSVISQLETGSRKINDIWITRISRALQCEAADLMRHPLIEEGEQDETSPQQGMPLIVVSSRKASKASQEQILFVGEAAAGVWREANADAFEPAPVTVAHDGRFPASALFVLRIRGTSVNRQAPDGSLILCLDTFHAPREPRVGDWIVARRTRNGFAEMTVKQLKRLESGEVVLSPDSTDPNHQEPIRVGKHDGDEVTIVAYVLDFIRQATKI